MDGPGFRLRHRRATQTVRGIVAAAAVAALVWSMAGGATAMPLPDTFRFLPAHAGDAGWYDASIEVERPFADAVHASAERFVSFRILDDRLALDRNGRLHAAHAVHQETGFFGLTDGVPSDLFAPSSDIVAQNAYLFDVDEHTWLGQERRLHYEHTNVAADGTARAVIVWSNTTTFSPDPGRDRLVAFHPLLCGLHNPLAGQRVELDLTLRLSSACTAGSMDFAGTGFVATSARAVDGETCVRFASGALRLTFCEHRSVPVEVRVEVARDVHVVYSLAGWSRGAAPPAPVHADPPAPPVPPAIRPFTAWGPDDSGWEGPWPPSAAYQAVAAEPAAAEWLKSQPEPVLLWLDGDGDAWTFRWGAGQGQLVAEATPEKIEVEAGAALIGSSAWQQVPAMPDWASAKRLMRDLFGHEADSVAVGGADCTDGRCRALMSLLSQHDAGDATEHRRLDIGADGTLVTYHETVRATGGAVDPMPAGGGSASVSAVSVGPAEPPPLIISVVAGAAAGAGAALWPHLRWGVFLYTRIGPQRLLEHPARARIAASVQREPGIHFASLRREVDLPTGTLDFHLRKLVSSGLVRQRIANGYACYFPQATDRQTMAAVPFLKASGARRVVEAVTARPGIDTQALAQATGLDASTVRHHVRRLARVLLVELVREGNQVHVHPTPLSARLV